MRLERSYAACPRVGTGLFPLDDELELLPGALTPRLAGEPGAAGELDAVRARGAGAGLADAGRWSVESVAERLTEAAGAAYVAEQTAAVERLEQRPTPGAGRAGRAAGQRRRGDDLAGRQAVGRGQDAGDRDGRPGGGRRRSGRASCRTSRGGPSTPTFRRLALVETYRRGVGTAWTVVAVMDGADWLQGFIDFHRPDADPRARLPARRRVPDPRQPRGARRRHGRDQRVARHAGPRPQARRPRPGAGRAARPAGRRAPRRGPRLPGATAGPAPVPDLPRGRATRSAAASSRAPTRSSSRIGSRAAACTGHPRSVDPMLALRTIVCADRWDEAWPQISARLRADARAPQPPRSGRPTRRPRGRPAAAQPPASAARAAAASRPPPPHPTTPPPPTPKTIVDGRPTKAHPWKRRFLPHRPASPAEN